MRQVILKSDFIRQMVRAAMTEYNAKIQEIEDRLAAAEDELRALKARDNKDELPKPPHQRPEIRAHQEYYYIAPYGGILHTKYDGISTEKMMRDIGNVFLDEGAADYAVEYFRVLSKMREWAGKWDDPWRLAYVNGPIGAVTVYSGKKITYGELRFACKEDAENCIKAVGEDRLKKYYFGIPEDDGCYKSES